jgi:hypothetical protein
VSFTAIILYIVSQRVFIVAVYFVIDSVRKLFDTSSQCRGQKNQWSRISTPPHQYGFFAWCSAKNKSRGTTILFTFYHLTKPNGYVLFKFPVRFFCHPLYRLVSPDMGLRLFEACYSLTPRFIDTPALITE